MSRSKRLASLIECFTVHEEMVALLNALPRSPCIYDDVIEDDYDNDLQAHMEETLVKRGYLARNTGYLTTTPAGREALVNYIYGIDPMNVEEFTSEDDEDFEDDAEDDAEDDEEDY